MKYLRLPFFILAFFAIGTFTLSAAQLSSVKTLNVTGSVTKYSLDGKSSALAAGDILKKGDSLSASALSSAKLVFSNGSIIDVKENTSISIAEFMQDQFSGGSTYEQLQADPSKSQVILELNYGEIDGHVKQLRQGSEFDIQTPIGTAAIRGTQFTVSLTFDAERGEYTLVVTNKDGTVLIKSRYADKFEYRNGIGKKPFDSSIKDNSSESIPKAHSIIIRLNKSDPYYDEVFKLLSSFTPPEDQGRPPVIIKIVTDPDDPGIQIVSPNTEDDQGDDNDNQ
ncbi:MAG TPA: hypothetical protein DCX06_05700 [Opitutae bacterium]|nr:hypothetical protein [Opitutae bacterium]